MKNKKRGFTLIELILYIGTSSLILLSISVFIKTSMESKVRNEITTSVNLEGVHVLNIINQNIRNAESIEINTQ